MILVDTNVVSEPMQPAPNTSVIAWLDAQVIETLYLSAITVAELRFGVADLPEGKRKAGLRLRLEDEILEAAFISSFWSWLSSRSILSGIPCKGRLTQHRSRSR